MGLPFYKYLTMQNLYHINLPPLEEFFNKEFIDSVSQYCGNPNDAPELKRNTRLLSEVINPEYSRYGGITWEGFVLVFGYSGRAAIPIHSDVDVNNGTVFSPTFNWNLNDTAIVNFWKPENVVPASDELANMKKSYVNDLQEANAGNVDTTQIKKGKSGKISLFTSTLPADESYNLVPGDTVMINATMPHQVISNNDRMCVSVRCSCFFDKSWEEVVATFKDLDKYNITI